MKKINIKNIEVGDFIYIIENLLKEKGRNRRFILKILSKKEGLKTHIYFWRLESASEKTSIFDPINHKGSYVMLKEDWKYYEVYKPNKKEIEKFKKLIILYNL